jgi:hypothetical protein
MDKSSPKQLDYNLGAGYAFKSGQIDGRTETIYHAANYYYAGSYDQGFNFGKLELILVRQAINTLNKHWNEASKYGDQTLSARIRDLREQKIKELLSLRKGEDL